ncbi:putative glycerol kinase [Fasciola hepatica]|uniref:Glycerol kinase n=1 Tax=Fasciola hepatica TaxID=6192 RepID=A0A4E0RK60_FASHE|nr:putative glycerol kinase [Fasciola hepatica]
MAAPRGSSQVILGIDYGSTHACATVYSFELEALATYTCKVERIEGSDGSCELDPEGVWDCFCRVLDGAMRNAGITPNNVACLGISVQRNSLMLWDRQTGKPRSRIISWQDLRATELSKKWNKSFIVRSLKAGGHVLYWISQSDRFKAWASYRFRTTLACIRLRHFFEGRRALLEECRQGRICYGCLETWFLWRLTNGKVFATDISCASVTGMYDPFTCKWSGPVLSGLGIPHQIIPDVCPSSHFYGYIEAGPLRAQDEAPRVPVTGIIGDAQAATLTEDCRGSGQAKLTLGTGTFLNMSTGCKPRALMNGFYPVVGWASTDKFNGTNTSAAERNSGGPGISAPVSSTFRSSSLTKSSSTHSLGGATAPIFASDLTYLLEGSHENTGTLIEWLRSEGLFDSYTELEDMLVEGDRLDLDLRSPACSTFYITVSPALLSTHQETREMRTITGEQRKLLGPDGILTGVSGQWTRMDRLAIVRAVMESIALTVRRMLDRCRKEAGVSPSELRVNGNVSLSNWLMQRVADVTNIPVQRSEFIDSSCLGAAITAGVGAGIWPDYASATSLIHGRQGRGYQDSKIGVQNCESFLPNMERVPFMRARYRFWCRACAAYSRKLRLTRFYRPLAIHRSSSRISSTQASHHEPQTQAQSVCPLRIA